MSEDDEKKCRYIALGAGISVVLILIFSAVHFDGYSSGRLDGYARGYEAAKIEGTEKR